MSDDEVFPSIAASKITGVAGKLKDIELDSIDAMRGIVNRRPQMQAEVKELIYNALRRIETEGSSIQALAALSITALAIVFEIEEKKQSFAARDVRDFKIWTKAYAALAGVAAARK